MDMLQMPVTIIVKAPNQRVDDHVVNCGLGWTVKKLKQHLSTSYPNQPKENQQRIIYSGKLLQDHHTLKDVFKHSYQESQTQHTVHLLCSATMSDVNLSENGSSKKDDTPSKEIKPEVSELSEGLRHRNVTTGSQYSNVNTSVPLSYVPYPSYPYYTTNGAPFNQAMMQYPGNYQGQYNQMLYYQQMYAHQMAQYMQYMQQMNPSYVAATATPDSAANNVAPQNVANQAPAQQQNQNNQQMVMNAAGGQAMFEDEEDLNRDWLDWSYILCRFAMLIAIVYFYSTLGRFFMVFCFFFVIYLYQSGWFRLNRRPAPQNQQNEEVQPAAQPQENNNGNEAEEHNGNGSNDTSEQESTEPVPPPPPPAPGVLRIALSFFVTFFTSLIPQQPGAVNAN